MDFLEIFTYFLDIFLKFFQEHVVVRCDETSPKDVLFEKFESH